jgi:parvulin-like peptidyl-prolyl isomerase
MSSPKQKQQNTEDTRKQDKERRPAGKNTFVYIGTIVILVISVVAFILAPSIGGGSSSAGKLPAFGSYAGKPIRYEQNGYMARQVQAINNQLKNSGYAQTDNQFFAFQVWRGAFERTVLHTALLHEAAKAHLSVSEDYLNERMLEQPEFLEDGLFSLEKYKSATESSKLTLRDSIREETLKSYILNDALSFRPSSREVAFLKSMAREERIVEFVSVPFASFPDSEKAAYGRENAAKFRRIKLSRITLNDEKEAQAVLAKVRDGSLSFEDAAKTHSKDAWADQGGVSGARWGYELDNEVAAVQDAQSVLALKAGEVSNVYKMGSGSYCFFRAEENAVEPDFSSSDTLKAVWDYMNQWEKGKIEDSALANAKAFAADAAGRGFASAAGSHTLKVQEAGPFPLNYGDAFSAGNSSLFRKISSSALAGASTNEKFLSAAFSLAAGAVSEPILLKDAAIVLRVKEIRSADDSSLELMQYYYPYLASQARQQELYTHYLKSPELKDDFTTAFFKIFQAN